ncbi:MAG: hypothetical protein M1165_02095, partial [Candidatus Pacearchaeota archaeon]|nr:hypothetical protein [Candidatus Pacearchaeota archaeon]
RSSDLLIQLKKILETERAPPAPAPKQSEAVKEESQGPLMKSILSKEETEKPTELSVVNPVKIKTQRQEIPDGMRPGPEYPVLRVPQPVLPPQFQYLRPVPAQKEIDLDKLNPFVNDPGVREIECLGPNKPIMVSGSMGRKPTGVILQQNEIEDILFRFSKASKIPLDLSGGIYRVVVGNLVLSAIMSNIVSSKFTITKMIPQNNSMISPSPNFAMQRG